jgi:hypothetical protein
MLDFLFILGQAASAPTPDHQIHDSSSGAA